MCLSCFMPLIKTMTRSQLLEGPKCESQTKNNGKAKSRGTLIGSQHFRGQRGMLELQHGTKKSDKQFNYSFKFTSNQPSHWLVLYWSTFGARISHKRLRTHKTHHGPNSKETTTFPHIVYSTPFHKGYIQMAFCPGTPKGESRYCQGQNSRNFAGL